MAEVTWSTAALAEIFAIVAHIRDSDPAAAVSVSRDITEAGESLSEFPNRGRKAARNRRELVTVWPYIIRYKVEGEEVTITSVRHGARHPRVAR